MAEAPPQKQPTEPEVGKAQPAKKQQSLIAQAWSGRYVLPLLGLVAVANLSTRGLVVFITMVGIPLAASYYLRR